MSEWIGKRVNLHGYTVAKCPYCESTNIIDAHVKTQFCQNCGKLVGGETRDEVEIQAGV